MRRGKRGEKRLTSCRRIRLPTIQHKPILQNIRLGKGQQRTIQPILATSFRESVAIMDQFNSLVRFGKNIVRLVGSRPGAVDFDTGGFVVERVVEFGLDGFC